jgi:hypothetical protein
MEFGPYNYREYDTFDDLDYTTYEDQMTGIDHDVVKSAYNQWTEFSSASDSFLDTKMWQVN